MIVNVVVVAPAGTIAEDGTEAAKLLLVRVTVVPPVPAGPLIVTVPVELTPPATELGVKLMAARVAGVIVNAVVSAPVPDPAVIVTVVCVFTPAVAISNVAEDTPDGTVTDIGTATFGLLAIKGTLWPPAGALPVRVTVPVADVPPCTNDGDTAIAFRGTDT